MTKTTGQDDTTTNNEGADDNNNDGMGWTMTQHDQDSSA
jgi:hypothetical protein